MSVQDFQRQVTEMSPEELKEFSNWFENYVADVWDDQIERDAADGKLNRLFERAAENYGAGRMTEL